LVVNKVWFITGSSAGFGRILAEELLRQGKCVVATARKPEVLASLREAYPETLLTPKLDVTLRSDSESSVTQAIEKFGKIDVLVNNAGFGVFGAIEDVPVEEARRQFDTNFFGVLNVLQVVLPLMRAQRGGRILNISSIAGLTSFMGTGIYCASKFALEAISESLHHELAPLGIRTILIEPGAFQTDFLGHNYTAHDAHKDDYRETVGKLLEFFNDFDGKQDGDPLKAVRAMIEVAERDDPPMRLLLGEDAWNSANSKVQWLQRDLATNAKITLDMNFEPDKNPIVD
jgi:NADP-dependent 3-hydroxy acid dehydrogenase YdfG